MDEPVELSERYSMVRLPNGDSGAFALQCGTCGALIIDAATHDKWHEGQEAT